MSAQFIPAATTRNLFNELLGSSYDTLPLPVQKLHHGSASITLHGTCKVERGTSRLSQMMGFFAKLPPAGENVPVRITIQRENGSERWIRRFGKHEMASTLSRVDRLLHEALGPVRFLFDLQASEQGIQWVPVRIKVMGLAFPLTWFRFNVQERADQGRYQFDVHVALIGLGLLVHYRGWLDTDV